jgi:hypothetical protein
MIRGSTCTGTSWLVFTGLWLEGSFTLAQELTTNTLIPMQTLSLTACGTRRELRSPLLLLLSVRKWGLQSSNSKTSSEATLEHEVISRLFLLWPERDESIEMKSQNRTEAEIGFCWQKKAVTTDN